MAAPQGERDRMFMRAALALATRGLGRTAPNPSVAALVVDERRDPPVVIGRGVTAPSGRPHAEDLALRQAGPAAAGCTIYVTLEPCARRSTRRFGLACTELILGSGIRRVVIAGSDPSPFAAGEGASKLREAGIEVVEGVLAAEAARVNRGHILRVRENRPFIRIKLARTDDGFAGTADGRPVAITGEEARAFVHRLRADCEAIVTGIDTALADDPMLDVRLPGMADWSPLRVIVDTEGRIRPDLRLLADAGRIPVVIATAQPEKVRALLAGRQGIEILALPRGADGRVDLGALLGALAARGITRAMVEAGPRLAEAFARAGFCDEFVLLTGPARLGAGRVAIGDGLAEWLAHADLVEERKLGPDRLARYRNDHPINEGRMMFTGIVSDIGRIVSAEGEGRLRRFRIATQYDPTGIAIGASIACAGICLTVTAKGTAQERWFEVEAAAETLRLTNAGHWQAGTLLNLERAMKLGEELGGHLVTGHVDGLAEIVSREEMTPDEANWGATARFTLRAPDPLYRYIAAKGSVTLDGTSLTVNTVEGDLFSVLLIPHTMKVTTWGERQAGDSVHLEIDLMARYAARLAETMLHARSGAQ